MLLLCLLLGFTEVARAGDSRLGVGLGAGALRVDPDETIGSSWIAAPRLAWMFDERWAVELDLGFSQGLTRRYARPYTLIAPLGSGVLRLPVAGPLELRLSASAGLAWRFVDLGAADPAEVPAMDAAMLLGGGPGLGLSAGPVAVHADVRYLASAGGVARGPGEGVLFHDLLAGLAVDFSLRGGGADRDSDGITDAADQCPHAAEDVDGYRDSDGCPDLDNDGDGVDDALDPCPDESEDFDGLGDGDGCKEWDFDGDGVLDAADGCPIDPEDADGNLDSDGCPDVDDDGDGVPDVVDPCPKVAGAFEASGCPDSDADRVPDFRDACPDEPVDRRADPTLSDGCPSEVLVGADRFVLPADMGFEGPTSRPDEVTIRVLEQVARALAAWPAVRKVEIAVMVPGDEALATHRAETLVGFLVQQGVRQERLVARGTDAGEGGVESVEIRILDRRH